MEIVSGPYTMVPQNITFAKPATLVFSIPGGVAVRELVLMEFRDGTWCDTTFSIINNTVTSSISKAGTYALFEPVHPIVTSTEAIPESTYISPTSGTTTQPTPTKTGMELSIIVGGLIRHVRYRTEKETALNASPHPFLRTRPADPRNSSRILPTLNFRSDTAKRGARSNTLRMAVYFYLTEVVPGDPDPL